MTSFKTDFEAFLFPPTWFPLEPTLQNYAQFLKTLPVGLFFLNSAKISVLATTGQLITSSLAGYAFARLDFPGRDALFLIAISTMMVPATVLIIPLFVIMYRVGWVGTHLPLIVPASLGSAYSTFMLRQYMQSLPIELEDAARIDGCTSFGIYYRIALPLMKPALATVGLFTFMGLWNDFMGPLIFIEKIDKYTVQLIAAIARGEYYTSQPFLMAIAVFVIVPVMVVFLALQRYFVQGIALTGIKG
jgi:multiple sugar transport system permease protein